MKDSQRKAIFANIKSKEQYVKILKSQGLYQNGKLGNTSASHINNLSIKILMTEDRRAKLFSLSDANDRNLYGIQDRIYDLKSGGGKPTASMLRKEKEYLQNRVDHHNIGMELLGQKLSKSKYTDAGGHKISLFESAKIPNK